SPPDPATPALSSLALHDALPIFDRLVSAAFSKRRKTLRNALAGWLAADAIAAAGIDPDLRPERLTPAQFARLANCAATANKNGRSEEHTSELQSRFELVCRLLLE